VIHGERRIDGAPIEFGLRQAVHRASNGYGLADIHGVANAIGRRGNRRSAQYQQKGYSPENKMSFSERHLSGHDSLIVNCANMIVNSLR
jgi:hypothetical protein